MQKIDVASAASVMPTPAAAGTPGFFTEGDPVSGEAATTLSADFMNMVMMELLNVVLATGQTPSKTTMTQLRDSLPKFSVSGNSVIFPSGLILNWGATSLTDSSGYKDVVFDTPYTVGNPFGFAVPASGPSFPSCWAGTGQFSKTGMRVGMSIAPSGGGSGVAASTGSTAYWFAVGR